MTSTTTLTNPTRRGGGTEPVAEPVVVALGLTKRYRSGVLAVDSVNLQVNRGEVYGFLGPNGAGKTTTMRMLLGLIRPTAGSVRVLGHAPGTPAGLAKVGALVESPGFYPYLSGRDNLRVLARYAGVRDTRVTEVLEIAGLSDRAGDGFGQYSLGMKQRLGVASTLLNDPDLLVLDEPTNGLDPAGMADMRRLIARLGAEALLHSEGVPRERVPGPVRQPRDTEHLLDPRIRYAGVPGQHPQVVPAGQVGIEARGFHQRADPGQAGRRTRRLPEHRDRTGRRPDQAQQHPHRGRLAGTVGSEEAVDLATVHLQVHGVHGEYAGPVPLGQPAGDDDWHSGLPALSWLRFDDRCGHVTSLATAAARRVRPSASSAYAILRSPPTAAGSGPTVRRRPRAEPGPWRAA